MHATRLTRRFVSLAAAALSAAGLTVGAVAVAAPAEASTARPHDPIGAVSSIKAVATGLAVTGWAADPDSLGSNVTVAGLVDGRIRAVSAHTSVANATVRAKYHTGPTPGFAITVPVAAGPHTVCIVARNIGAGLEVALKCVVTPLGTKLTSAQLALHNPVGAVQSASVSATSMRVRGWSDDPDWLGHKLLVVLYVDGRPATTIATHKYTGTRPAGAGGYSAFDITVPVSRGAHLGCIWSVNAGLGHNSFLGCNALDTRGKAGTGTVTTPALNTKVLAEAKKHLGQPYVWGDEGPKRFDCSGLVWYSYHKFGYTPPRISEDQFTAARMIPASRAVPGDLVFYHDTEGDVYHVGIYLSPGKTIAAVDPQEGVTYQSIWDPSSTTYGSFTHS